jgi:hypothetical protein
MIVYFCQNQFNAAVRFITLNNPYFLGCGSKVHDSLKNFIQRSVENKADIVGTMGLYLSIEYFENTARVDIWVDPSVGYSSDEVEIRLEDFNKYVGYD